MVILGGQKWINSTISISPLENDRKWLYQPLPIKYELKLLSEVNAWSFCHSDPDPSNVSTYIEST